MFRLAFVSFIVLTLLYVVASLCARHARRARLEREWQESAAPGSRDAFVERGLKAYDDSLARKLMLLIYVVPVVIVAFIIYAVNFM
ncbi:hypothetical protein DL237_12230 [Pseudooceanicola sediminis]|uniref:Cation/multidrug efflux pump n=1 Tax=Pseudooceanicola sediminis TaxID=2211117 RepID=A0A399IZP1_9RHOB|nr:hypothetical protein [Pseudooceanicola sediminis]KAA2313439.1 hypothetical protein E0K93_14625 [Puniceibacterium sp. HSS470]RII38424.1 hypothetical protein DL237_12230 [Pseudooceanicola sediminis]